MILQYFSEQPLAPYDRSQVWVHSCRSLSPESAEGCKRHLYSFRPCHPQLLLILPASLPTLPPTCTQLMPVLMLHTRSCVQETHSFFCLDCPPLSPPPSHEFLLHSFRPSSDVTSSMKPALLPLVHSGYPCFPSIHYLRYREAKITNLKTFTNK